MNDIFEQDVAFDGPVATEGELSSSTISTGQGSLIGSLDRGQCWTVSMTAPVMSAVCPGVR